MPIMKTFKMYAGLSIYLVCIQCPTVAGLTVNWLKQLRKLIKFWRFLFNVTVFSVFNCHHNQMIGSLTFVGDHETSLLR